MAEIASPDTLRARLQAPRELALLDVREYGEYADGHLFLAVPLPYSRLESDMGRLVPRLSTPIVLCDDDGQGVSRQASRRLEALGYTDVSILDGGARGWRERGLRLFAGVNVPSKTFGELIHQRYRTPQISAYELAQMKDRGDDVVLVDGRPWSEFARTTIPGAICCPNGELALRIDAIAPSPQSRIVVSCAGRTRSIIGAETLRALGLPNPVFSLENGTQGWVLAGFGLERGASARYPESPQGDSLEPLRIRSKTLAARHRIPLVEKCTLREWIADRTRTTYLFDVRTEEERGSSPLAGTQHAPGGQLIQATDHWIGVQNARIVLFDDDGVRAPPMAMWLRQMGHDACVFVGQHDAHLFPDPQPAAATPLPELVEANFVPGDGAVLIDLRPSMAYRAGHAKGAVWSIRPRIGQVVGGARRVGLIADEPLLARAAALDLKEAGVAEVFLARSAGIDTSWSGDLPDEACIDFVFFAHGRHEGDRAAAVQYLAWEQNLVSQLEAWELARFRIPGPRRSTGAGIDS